MHEVNIELATPLFTESTLILASRQRARAALVRAMSTRSKRSAVASSTVQESGTPLKVARVGAAESVKDRSKKKGERHSFVS